MRETLEYLTLLVFSEGSNKAISADNPQERFEVYAIQSQTSSHSDRLLSGRFY